MSIDDRVANAPVDARARNFYDFIGRPIQHCSLFYTTYWLTEVKQIDAAAFDLQRLRNESYLRFLDYGVYSVIREISNIRSAFAVDGTEIMNRPPDSDTTEGDLGRLFLDINEENQDVDAWGGSTGPGRPAGEPAEFSDDERQLVIKIFEEAGGIQRMMGLKQADVVKTCNATEVHWSAYSRPERFLNVCRKLFRFGYLKIADTGWHANYGGAAWASICRHVLRADDLPETSWVDQCWDIQHNNANWMDKLDPAHVEVEHLTRLADFPEMRNPTEWVFRKMLPQVLDWNRAGDWDNLYPLATTYDFAVDVNLHRLSRILDIDLPAGEEGIIHTTLAGEVAEIGEASEPPRANYVRVRLERQDSQGNEVTIDPQDEQSASVSSKSGRVRSKLKNSVIGVGDTVTVKHLDFDAGDVPPSQVPDLDGEIEVIRPTTPAYVDGDTSVEANVDHEPVDPIADYLDPGGQVIYHGNPSSDHYGEVLDVVEKPEWAGEADLYLDVPGEVGGVLAVSRNDVAPPPEKQRVNG